MKHKLYTVLAALLLLFNAVPVYASNTLPIFHANNYDYSMGGGSFTYTVPFTGNYEITLSGAHGASYNSNSGGYGYTLKQTIHLNYGDQVTFDVSGVKPSYYQSGSVLYVPGGACAKFYVNETLIWTAGGGAGTIDHYTAPSRVTTIQCLGGSGNTSGISSSSSVHWHNGNTDATAPFPDPTSVAQSGACYTGYHQCTNSCPSHREHNYGGTCHDVYHKDENGDDVYAYTVHYDTTVHDCNNSPINRWRLDCGKTHGQILSGSTATAGTCYVRSGYNPTQSLSNTGNCSARIRLVEQTGLYYDNGLVRTPIYKDDTCNLVVKDNVVCYFKRR